MMLNDNRHLAMNTHVNSIVTYETFTRLNGGVNCNMCCTVFNAKCWSLRRWSAGLHNLQERCMFEINVSLVLTLHANPTFSDWNVNPGPPPHISDGLEWFWTVASHTQQQQSYMLRWTIEFWTESTVFNLLGDHSVVSQFSMIVTYPICRMLCHTQYNVFLKVSKDCVRTTGTVSRTQWTQVFQLSKSICL